MVFITKAGRVYKAVQTEPLYIIQVNLSLQIVSCSSFFNKPERRSLLTTGLTGALDEYMRSSNSDMKMTIKGSKNHFLPKFFYRLYKTVGCFETEHLADATVFLLSYRDALLPNCEQQNSPHLSWSLQYFPKLRWSPISSKETKVDNYALTSFVIYLNTEYP